MTWSIWKQLPPAMSYSDYVYDMLIYGTHFEIFQLHYRFHIMMGSIDTKHWDKFDSIRECFHRNATFCKYYSMIHNNTATKILYIHLLSESWSNNQIYATQMLRHLYKNGRFSIVIIVSPQIGPSKMDPVRSPSRHFRKISLRRSTCIIYHCYVWRVQEHQDGPTSTQNFRRDFNPKNHRKVHNILVFRRIWKWFDEEGRSREPSQKNIEDVKKIISNKIQNAT